MAKLNLKRRPAGRFFVLIDVAFISARAGWRDFLRSAGGLAVPDFVTAEPRLQSGWALNPLYCGAIPWAQFVREHFEMQRNSAVKVGALVVAMVVGVPATAIAEAQVP